MASRVHDTGISSPIQKLLPDCRDAILQYLSIRDCLRYGTTSKTNLVGILTDLQRRRKEQFLCRHLYQLHQPSVLKTRTIIVSKESINDGANGDICQGPCLVSTVDQTSEEDTWHELPSVAERIQSLYRSLPSSHPFNSDVRELMLDLTQTKDMPTALTTKMNESNDSIANSININGTDFEYSLAQLRRLTKAHRLHASLLFQCTIHCNPKRCDPGLLYNTTVSHGASRRDGAAAAVTTTATTTTNNTSEGDASNLLTVFLTQYIGDVLSAYYLLGHSVAGLVEGGPSHGQWTTYLSKCLRLQQTNNNTGTSSINALEWYQLWVYMHSSLLRLSPFTPTQQTELGLCPSGIYQPLMTIPVEQTQEHTTTRTTDSIVPPYPFVVGAGSTVVGELTELTEVLSEWTPNMPHGIHRTTFNHFGPLGPTFRGRDRVESIWMSPWPLISLLKKQAEVSGFPRFRPWLFAGRNEVVLQWLLQLLQECKKSRPMTVTPPLVRISF